MQECGAHQLVCIDLWFLARLHLTLLLAFLPSSFALYANSLAFSFAVEPPSNANAQRTLFATLCFAAGAIVGWPFSILISIPFVLEELFVRGIDRVPDDKYPKWVTARWQRLFGAAAVSALLVVSGLPIRLRR
jgi:alpha-1,2-mannosyltransferase